jgi:hypothetical protein
MATGPSQLPFEELLKAPFKESVKRAFSKGPRRGFVSQLGFWRPWVPRPQIHMFFRKEWFVGLAAEGGPANKTTLFWKMCGVLALVLQASKKTLGQKNTSGSI